MDRRYLFGPVTAAFAEQHLARQRQAGECLAFDATGTMDLAIGLTDTWDDVCRRLPADWRPDFIALYLPYTTLPEGLWSAPVPLVGLAADANLCWHSYRRQLPRCELILTDTSAAEVMVRAGITPVRTANLFGCERAFLDDPDDEERRDIDILFVGNLQPAVQRQRLPWLGRLAGLADHRCVVIQQGAFGDDYRRLLSRARIVFNHSIRGECNKRAFEAAAAGALLFQEADNREVGAFFRDRWEYVGYTADNLEQLLEHYLDHEDERCAVAEAARARVRHFTFEKLWEQHLGVIAWEWPGLVERVSRRPQPAPAEALLARTWQALGAGSASDPQLTRDLAGALAQDGPSAALHNALGIGTVGSGQRAVGSEKAAEGGGMARVAGYFQRALACDPDYVVAGLNLVEALAAAGQSAEAIEAARRVLARLEQPAPFEPAVWDAAHYPPGFDFFRVEWERAAWTHAGQPAAEAEAKKALLCWRLHTLLSDLTGHLTHYYEAAVARPDLPPTRAALGCALARAGQPAEVVGHLRQALTTNPFDLQAARALFQALGANDDGPGQRRLADQRRLLAKAAPGAVPIEDWIAQVPPLGEELVSIIILCCNELDDTRRCLESVRRHSRPPYELLLVDNGSTDGTTAFLEEVRSQSGPGRVVVLTNAHNRGFAAGCNQALAQARGRYVVFLNNDTVVTTAWLEGLIGGALVNWPQVGLVGAVSNYVPPPQYVAPEYTDLMGLAPFAARQRQQFAGQGLIVERLSGFCLLARREVLDQVGGFDERFGLGFFEDDDLGVRVREAGFQLRVARDVYVHHVGSRTVAGLGLDGRRQLDENLEEFRAKWGAERAARYQLPEEKTGSRGDAETRREEKAPGPVAADSFLCVSASPREHLAVSLCLIVKNEEANLPACLESAADLVQEIIVVDTGSTDGTKEVARRFGAQVFDFPWVDSFAAARNECLNHASGDWIFWLDADDRLDKDNRRKLRALCDSLRDENAAYGMKCVCLPDSHTGTATVVDHVRLFRRHPDIRWQYRVHEQILPAIRQLGGDVRLADVVIQYVGYQDAAVRAHKQERDLRLLRLDQEEHPDDPFILFNLGWNLEELGQPVEALPLLQRSLERSHPSDSIVRKLFTLIVECHRQRGDHQEALAACQEGRRFYPDDAQLLFQEGLLRQEQSDYAAAEACFLDLLRGGEGPHFGSVAEGLRGFQARHNLAVLCREQGRGPEAEAHWQAALADHPAFVPARVGLAELYLDEARWPELTAVIDSLANEPGPGQSPALAAVLRARGHLARREFAAAQQILEEAIATAPRAVLPRVVLSHVFLQEGMDWHRAEQALRDVLELDPDHAEARSNLALLLDKHGRQSPRPVSS